MHAKSTGELISFGFNDHSVRSLVSDYQLIAQRFAEIKRKQDFTLWRIFGLSPNLASDSLSERVIPKVKWPADHSYLFGPAVGRDLGDTGVGGWSEERGMCAVGG